MVVYRPLQSDDYEVGQMFLTDNGWAARVSDAERFRAMLDGADLFPLSLSAVRAPQLKASVMLLPSRMG